MSAMNATPEDVGIVVIGRNEGDRLRACLESAGRDSDLLVYVDSGSTDGSVELARGLGAEVVVLDSDMPFTAARARNAGFERLVESRPALARVQFVDGDCEFEVGWIREAAQTLAEGNWSVVCGRRRERHPERSIYNRLCDMEWDTEVGEATACGGDSMMQVAAFREVEGFSDDLIAGEEPELCVRIAAAGGRILRLDAPMTIHDARMFSFAQWWTRAVRAGHAVAEAAARHPGVADGRNEREIRSIWFWGFFLPGTILATAFASAAWSLVGLLAWPLQTIRIARRRPRPNFSARDNLVYAASCVLSKFPHMQGVLRFMVGQWTGHRSRLIEYKGAS